MLNSKQLKNIWNKFDIRYIQHHWRRSRYVITIIPTIKIWYTQIYPQNKSETLISNFELDSQKYWCWVSPMEVSRNQAGDFFQNKVLPMQVSSEGLNDNPDNNLITTQNQNNEVVRVITL